LFGGFGLGLLVRVTVSRAALRGDSAEENRRSTSILVYFISRG
jgi:hypothetical protein